MALVLVNISFAQAQDSRKNSLPSIGETLFIHSNATTFVTGETFYCKLYCLNPADNSPSQVSKIAYIELIENTRKSVLRQKVYMENGVGQGDFFIPTTLKTGNYKLIAYTKWMLNYNNRFEMDVTVINPFQPLEKGNISTDYSVVSNSNALPVLKSDPQNSFFIETDKNSYSQREKVNLKIRKPAEKMAGSYSISVRKANAFPEQPQLTAKNFLQSVSKSDNPAAMVFLPELRGELISGSIISNKGISDLNHRTVALSIAGKSFALKVVETNKAGKFNFILDKNPNLSNVIIQVMDENRNDFSIQLDAIPETNLSSLQFLPEFRLSPELRKSLEERSVANQIENAYYEKKKDSIVADNQSEAFFQPLEKVYILDDYTRFPTMKETITEVVFELYYVKKHNKYSIHIRDNSLANETFGPPLLMVDGLLIQDPNELFDYNTENIYKISLINQPYIYGPKTFSGVINITTKNQDYQTKATGDFIRKLEIPRPLNQKKYYRPDYAGNKNSRIPDYRQQLLWLPEAPLKNAETDISFYTSDSPGQYEIVLEGFTEAGVPITLRNNFNVK